MCGAFAQKIDRTASEMLQDSISISEDTILKDTIPADIILADTIPADSVSADSLKLKPQKRILEYEVPYSATDSIRISLKDNKAFLYGTASLSYGDMNLASDYMELDMDRKTAYASGRRDSTDTEQGKPVFKQNADEFESDNLSYNFETKRGVIRQVITEQNGGYLHATTAKRYDNGHINIAKGKFTTCDDEHPHFYLAMTKAKVIPGRETVSGPAYMVLEDVPLPIGIPFGLIPTTKDSRQSGIIIPTWGEEATRGFNLTGGGYYFALNPHYDLRTTFDVYSKGTWGTQMISNYKLRYRFAGSFNARYYKDVSGEPGLNQTKSTSMSLKWSHNVDQNAIPGQSFSISIDYSTKSFDKLHNYWNASQLMTNTKQSSISYSKNWANKPFHLTVNGNHSQSTGTNEMTIMLPSFNFKVDRFYPFKRRVAVGKAKWYENIQTSYTVQGQNTLKGPEKNIFSDSAMDRMVNGLKQTIPVTMNFKILKQINVSPSVTYNGYLYSSHLEKRYDPSHLNSDGSYGAVVNDTLRGPSYAHSVNPNISVSYSPNLYIMGEARSKFATVQKVRDVISTSIGLSYAPDVSNIMPNYYRDLNYVTYDSTGQPVLHTDNYSMYQGYLYGTPTINGKSGSISFSLKNNLEAKVRPKEFRNDSTELQDSELQKVKLWDNLSFNTSYNMFADSMKLSNINFSGSNSFFGGKLNVQFSGNFSPYALDENGRPYNKLLIGNGGLIRLTSFSMSPSFRIDGTMGRESATSSSDSESESEDRALPIASDGRETPAQAATQIIPYDYFSVPWSLSVSYNFTYSKPGKTSNVIQTAQFSGDLSLTPKWKVSFSSGYDFKMKEVTHTSISINRDLHCWVMSLTLSPIGVYKFYGFQINVKSSVLQDLKYNKNKSQYDYTTF